MCRNDIDSTACLINGLRRPSTECGFHRARITASPIKALQHNQRRGKHLWANPRLWIVQSTSTWLVVYWPTAKLSSNRPVNYIFKFPPNMLIKYILQDSGSRKTFGTEIIWKKILKSQLIKFYDYSDKILPQRCFFEHKLLYHYVILCSSINLKTGKPFTKQTVIL